MTQRRRMTRSEQRQRTRAELLDAAVELFTAKGYAGTSVDAIAERAGYTSGAVYDHFASKEGVLVATVEHAIATDLDIDSFIDGQPDEERVRALGRVAAAIENPLEQLALTYETYAHAMRNPELRQRIGELLGDALRRVGARMAPAGNLSGTDRAVLGQALYEGLRLRAKLNPELVRPELFEEGLALLAGLSQPTAPTQAH